MQQRITSKDNERIRHLRRLIDDRAYRYECGSFAVEGIRVLDNAGPVRELFVLEGTPPPPVTADKTYVVSPDVFRKITSTGNSQGIVAVLPLILKDGSAIDPGGCYVLLDRVQDPGNMGTIIRTAHAFALDGVIITPGCVDPFSPKVARAAASALGGIAMIRVEAPEGIVRPVMIAADTRGEPLPAFAWPEAFILAVGNEASGLSEEIRSVARSTVSIPISRRVESLNAAVAAGILLYAARAAGGSRPR